jgi:predicted enzyme related to lactoylglutathione lyase
MAAPLIGAPYQRLRERQMVEIKGVAHFSIPVSDIPRSTQFYTDVVGCRHLSTTPNGQMVFLDAAPALSW